MSIEVEIRREIQERYLRDARERGVEFERTPEKRVVVVGSEAATSYGDEQEMWDALLEGVSAIQYLPQANNMYTNIGGPLHPKYDDPQDEGEKKRRQHFKRKRYSRLAQITSEVVIKAAQKAKIADKDGNMIPGIAHPHRRSSTVSSGYAEGHRIINIWRHLHKDGDDPENVKANSRRVDMHDSLAVFDEEYNGDISVTTQSQGHNLSSPEACATGASSIAEGYELIRSGRSHIVFAGAGEDALHEYADVTLGVFSSGLHACARDYDGDPTHASRPYDRDRQGFVPASGIGIIVLEGEKHARERGAPILAELVGAAKGSDAGDKTKLDPARVADVIAQALYDEDTGDFRIPDVGSVHATSTLEGDRLEAEALRKVFGKYLSRIPMTAIKSLLGHTMGASGALNAIVAIRIINEQIMPAIYNCDNPDPEIMKEGELYLVRQKPLKVPGVDLVLAPAFGFGGNNCALLFKRYKP